MGAKYLGKKDSDSYRIREIICRGGGIGKSGKPQGAPGLTLNLRANRYIYKALPFELLPTRN